MQPRKNAEPHGARRGGCARRIACRKLANRFRWTVLLGAALLAGACLSFAQSTSHEKVNGTEPQKKEGVIVPSEILYGAAYYHEYEPYERLDQDIAMMKEAGLNVVRMGESTWSLWEPEDGHFEYAWMDRVVDAMGKAGIKVIMDADVFDSYVDVSGASRDTGAPAGRSQDLLRHAPEHGYG
jgi:beta-glucosidase/6-phospho-beta-glucosidase/beta-galactosidase